MFEGMNKEQVMAARNEAIDQVRRAESVIDDHTSGECRRDDIADIFQIMYKHEEIIKQANNYIEKMGWDEDDDED